MEPIYRIDMAAVAWQLLWWMLCEMDEKQLVRGGWRSRAAKAMGRERAWVGRCAGQLLEKGLIETKPGSRYVTVLAKNIVA